MKDGEVMSVLFSENPYGFEGKKWIDRAFPE
jgi:hypothetical protein